METIINKQETIKTKVCRMDVLVNTHLFIKQSNNRGTHSHAKCEHYVEILLED